MRWLAWTMLMAIAVGAGAAGVNGELNPVRTHPHGSTADPIAAVIVKFRSASHPAHRAPAREAAPPPAPWGPSLGWVRGASHSAHGAQVRPARDRIAALTARTGL